MQTPTYTVKYNLWINAGLAVYKDHFLTILAAMLIAGFLTLFTCGILGAPLYAGMALMVLRMIDRQDPKPEAGDVFKGMQFFLPAFLLFLLQWGITIGLQYAVMGMPQPVSWLVFVPGFVVNTFLMFSVFFICDRKMDVWPAICRGFEIVKTDVANFLGFFLLVWLLSVSGAALCGVGILATLPIMLCVTAVAYRDLTRETDAAAEPPPPPALNAPEHTGPSDAPMP